MNRTSMLMLVAVAGVCGSCGGSEANRTEADARPVDAQCIGSWNSAGNELAQDEVSGTTDPIVVVERTGTECVVTFLFPQGPREDYVALGIRTVLLARHLLRAGRAAPVPSRHRRVAQANAWVDTNGMLHAFE